MQNGTGGEARPAVVASAARALGVGMWPTFVGAVPGSWVCVEGDVAAFDSGTDIARFNAVAAPTGAAAPRAVGRLAEALAARTDSFSLHTPVPCSRALRDMAHDLHLIEEQEPLMLLEPRHLVAAANTSDAQISRLRPDQIERHVDVWARGFGVPAEALTPWLGSDLLYRPNVIAYQASLDGVDVATALGIVADGFVGVFNVACVESHRRRGYGAALTAKVVLDGLGGADMAVLTSSPSGDGVYRALGFREVARWAQWLLPCAHLGILLRSSARREMLLLMSQWDVKANGTDRTASVDTQGLRFDGVLVGWSEISMIVFPTLMSVRVRTEDAHLIDVEFGSRTAVMAFGAAASASGARSIPNFEAAFALLQLSYSASARADDLRRAAGAGDTTHIDALLDAGADVNGVDVDGDGARTTRRAGGIPDSAAALLERGANPNLVGTGSALSTAAAAGNTEIAQLLLAHGADPEVKLRAGGGVLHFTALMLAAGAAQDDAVRVLVASGANLSATDDDGDSVLLYAVSKGHLRTARLLLTVLTPVRNLVATTTRR